MDGPRVQQLDMETSWWTYNSLNYKNLIAYIMIGQRPTCLMLGGHVIDSLTYKGYISNDPAGQSVCHHTCITDYRVIL